MEYDPSEQKIESMWRNYANTLERDLAGKLNKDIGNHRGKYINNLQDVMNRAREVEFKERTNRVYRNRKDNDDATQIKEVNELDYDNFEENNELQNFEPRFSSTMKPQNNSFGAQNSGYQSTILLETIATNKTVTHQTQIQVTIKQATIDQTTAKTPRIDMIAPQTLLDTRAKWAKLIRPEIQPVTHTHNTTDHTTPDTTNSHMEPTNLMVKDMLTNTNIMKTNPETE